MSLPRWLLHLVAPDVVGISVAYRTPEGILTRCWLDKDIPLRVAGAMANGLAAAIRAVMNSLVLETAVEEDVPEDEGEGTVH
jgi:hypothetical protein